MRGVGKVLAMIGAILEIILIVLNFIGISFSFLDQFNFSFQESFGAGPIMTLVFALVLLFVAMGRVSIKETLVFGITVIILAVLVGGLGGLLAIIGGVLIILGALSK